MIRPAPAARFRPGDAVQVLDAEKSGHVRTPDYVKGKKGRIQGVVGAFPNPELLAYGGSGHPEKALYRVAFRQADLWEGYEGQTGDALLVDVYEHWLEPAGEER